MWTVHFKVNAVALEFKVHLLLQMVNLKCVWSSDALES